MGIYKKLFKYVPEKKYLAYISMFLASIAAILAVGAYYILWNFLYALLVTKNVNNAKLTAIIIVSFLVCNILFTFFATWASHLLAFRLETNLRKTAITHLMEASFSFFDTNASGKIRKLIDDNAAETHTIVAHLIPDNTNAILMPILLFVVMFLADWQLGLLLLVITIIGVFQVKFMMGEKTFMKTYMKALERMNAEAVEYVRGIQVVKIFRGTIQSFKAFYDSVVSYSKDVLAYTISCRIPWVSFQVIMNMCIVFTIPFAIIYLNYGASVNLIIAKVIFFACSAGLLLSSFMRVMYVGMYNMQAGQVVTKLENLFDEMEKNKLEHGKEERFENFNIEFKNVSFGYGDENILKSLSFSLPEKKTYALVGSSGGGKSTIAKLISGFYKVKEGEILIGGKNIVMYSKEALMKNIAFVFQNAKLFKTSIFENVKMGNPEATDNEVMQALKAAQCEPILSRFKEREKTLIGSKGVHLSGGEIQRIAIARAILKNAPIIILDEASAATDPENEYEIQQAFSALMKDKTVIMIAHRLSSIKNVDEILVIENGNVIERGSDEALQKQAGKYKTLQDLFSKANTWRIYDK